MSRTTADSIDSTAADAIGVAIRLVVSSSGKAQAEEERELGT
jgi:hypothetical protein